MPKINLKDYVKHLDKLSKTDLRAAVLRGVISGVTAGLKVLDRRTREAVPASQRGSIGAFNYGDYLRGWKFAVLPGDKGARLLNIEPHAAIVEYGRRPGRRPPSSRVIAKWAQRKLGLSAKEAKQAAFPIARAIGKRGLRPRKVLAGAKKAINALVKREIKHEIGLLL